METDFRFDITLLRLHTWRHFTQNSSATWWVNTKRLPCAYAAASANVWVILLCRAWLVKEDRRAWVESRADLVQGYVVLELLLEW